MNGRARLLAYGLSLTGLPVLPAPEAVAQTDRPGLVPGETVLTTPEGRYSAGPVHRFLLGTGHRDLWPLPVSATVLDLDAWAGGLTVRREGGGLQTRSLRFSGADGQTWSFRSVDKDAARALDPELRRTIAASVMQDRISALMPLSAMVVDSLLGAAGVLHPHPTLVVMPDDPALGEFREAFAGLLGWVEVRPDEGPGGDPGFAGSGRVVSSPTLMERIEEDPDQRVDAEAYLQARLMDVFVGDWDRHPDQWRWAGFQEGQGLRFQPVPRDRDWALSRLDGVVGAASWAFWPHYVGFGHDYPSAFRATWSARVLDRRLLSELGRSRWEAVAEELQRVLTDDVIDGAVATLPASYLEALGAELRADFRNRRDRLTDFAGEWYDLLAGWVDVHATDQAELARIDWTADGGARVRIHRDPDGGGDPYYDRTLLASESRELRLYMHGGDDRVSIQGPGAGRIRIRVVGGGGDDELVNATEGSGGRVHFYDDRGSNRFDPGPGARVDETPFRQPFDPSRTTHQAPFRDWGARWLPLPTVSYDPDQGVFLGFGFVRTGYGFRYYPYHTQWTVTAGAGTGAGRLRASLTYDFPLTGREWRGTVSAYASGADANRFYGLGNDTQGGGEGDRYHANRREIRIELPVVWSPEDGTRVSMGPVFKNFAPFDTTGTLIAELEPYGFQDFSEVGLLATLEWDRRDRRLATTRGTFVRLEGRAFPSALDVREAFGAIRGWGAGFVTVPGRFGPTLAARAGGERIWGEFPYQEAAYLGGPTSLRGYRNQRFAGEASLFLNSEARFRLGNLEILVPGDVGIYALADVGRVFVDRDDSDRLHTSYGGGAWLTLLDVFNLNLSVAAGSEQTLFYFVSGFTF